MQESIFQTYLNRLIDLSSKNKSMYLSKTEGSGILDLSDFDFLNGGPAFELIKAPIQRKSAFAILPESDPRQAETNQLSKSLSRLKFKSDLIFDETGNQSLSIAWLFVEGKLISGQVVRAPLLFQSCQLVLRNNKWYLNPEGDFFLNPSFILAYEKAYNSGIKSIDLDGLIAEFPKEATSFRTELHKLLQKHFSLKVSSNLFEDKIQKFPHSSKSLDSERFNDGVLKLKPYALLGLFEQKNSFLFKEYEGIELTGEESSLEEFLEKRFRKIHTAKEPREEDTYPIFPMDSSQEEVFKKVRQGRNMVVEGPPGTGKSQLISNLITDYVARGKRVLLVSQKRAALDVVFERLDKEGFGSFLGLVHDYRADQKSLFGLIKNQIESIENYQEQNRGLDSIALEREVSIKSRNISTLSRRFEELRQCLFDSSVMGLSIKELYLRARPRQAGLNLPDLHRLDYQEANEFENHFRTFFNFQTTYTSPFWIKRKSLSQLKPSEFGEFGEALLRLDKLPDNPLSKILINDRSVLEQLLQGKKYSKELTDLLKSFGSLENSQLALAALNNAEIRKELEEAWIIADRILKQAESQQFIYPKNWSGLNLESSIIEGFLDSSYSSFLWIFKRGKFKEFNSWIEASGKKFSLSNLESAFSLFESIKSAEENLLSFQTGFEIDMQGLPSFVLELGNLLDWITNWKGNNVFTQLGYSESASESPESFLSESTGFIGSLESIEIDFNVFRNFFSKEQLEGILDGSLVTDNSNLGQTLSDLVAFDQFLETWTHQELGQILSELNLGSKFESYINHFWNEWHWNWIDRLEAKNPILQEAGSVKLNSEIDELQRAILEKREIAKDIALLRLKEKVVSNLEFNRLGNRTTYRDLLHQVSKKRLRWPLRKVISEFDSELFRLVPCWLASPETVSALFPVKESFDLVIFDEASQCQVERGLPGMLRGNQIVIAGDSMQLPPSDFYKASWQDDDEGIEYESESILELSRSYFDFIRLKGHYRSENPSLIHFSNNQFYDSHLECLPELKTMLTNDPAFTWTKVEGIWDQQRNKSEAEEVVTKVGAINEKAPNARIGVVTSNYFQMELISELLWTAGLTRDDLKVRNIENVQGDEFDEVIISLGYAANRDGKLTTNFGLLSKSGGSRRLNVAVSRARKKIHIITSFNPEEFRPKQLENEGIRLLREYFLFAREQSISPKIPSPVINPTREFSNTLRNKLIESESDYDQDIPSSLMDLILSKSDQESLAILTDDQRFFNASSAKAALAYHPILLRSKGWQYQMKWSREQLWP